MKKKILLIDVTRIRILVRTNFLIVILRATAAVPKIRVSLNIPAHRYLAYYEGGADDGVATSVDGRKVRFPARVLRPFLTQRGIVGTFLILYDAHHKFVSIEKAEDPYSS